jgi:biopolymer transport protein ExbD
MSSVDYVQLVLPQSKTAQKPDPDVKAKYIVINIDNKRDKVTGKPYYQLRGGNVNSYEKLEKIIKIESKAAGKEPNPEAPGSLISTLKVVIRCDKSVEYGVVQEIFKACSLNGVWKIVVAANEPEK